MKIEMDVCKNIDVDTDALYTTITFSDRRGSETQLIMPTDDAKELFSELEQVLK